MTDISESIMIGAVEVKNRLAVAPTETMLASPKDGLVTERLLDRYEYLAMGGWGLICVEVSYIRFDGCLFRNKLSVASDFHVSGLSELASAVKMGNAKASLQIMHGGRQAALRSEKWGFEAVAPSPIPIFGLTPRELTTRECEELIDVFAVCAERAKEAGFDAVTIHGANGFLPQQFMSPAYNIRSDKYKDRMLWSVELVKRIKEATGASFPVIWRLSADELLGEKGITLSMTKNEIVPALEGAGVDCLDITAGCLDSAHMIIPTNYQERGCLMHLAENVKEVAHVPVIGVGNISSPELARKVISDGRCDIVAVSRAAIADPHFASKTLNREDDDINRCIACYKCTELGFSQKVIKCSVNPSFGNERKGRITKALHPKRVLVVGGGPGGMTAAIAAVERGHDVTLVEKDGSLGGQLRIASVPPGKEQIEFFTDNLRARIVSSDVNVILNRKADADIFKEVGADIVIVATGAVPFIPEFCCSDSEQFLTLPNVVTAFDILGGKAGYGNVVAIIGGDRVACETADFITEKGAKATITRRGSEIGASYGPVIKQMVLGRLRQKDVVMIPNVIYEKITADGLVIIENGMERLIEAETIIVAAGLRREVSFYEKIKGNVKRVYLIGDCDNPSDILNATAQGFQIGCNI